MSFNPYFQPPPGTQPTTGPIISNLPQTQSSFQRKYQDPIFSQLPRNIVAPLARFDLERANRGQFPLTDRQTVAVLKALQTGEPANKRPKKGLLGSALSDLATIVTSLPKLPHAIYTEGQKVVTDLPEMLSDVPAANPLQALGNIANLPGVRIAPGTFVLGAMGEPELGGEEQQVGLSRLREHPVFTGLDVLPLAHGAARATPVARANMRQVATLNDAALTAAKAEGRGPGTAILQPTPRPIQTVLTRRINRDTGLVEPNLLGQATARATDALQATNIGRQFEATFGRRGRVPPRIANEGDAALAQAINPKAPPVTHIYGRDVTAEGDLARRSVEFAREAERVTGGDAARMEAVTRAMEDPRLPDGTPTSPELVPGLSDPERALLTQARTLNDELARMQEGEFTGSFGGEVYDIKTANQLNKLQRRVEALEMLRAGRPLLDESLGGLREAAKTQPRAQRALLLLDQGNYTAALSDLRGLRARTKFVVDVGDGVLQDVADLRDLAKWGGVQQGKVSARALNVARKRFETVRARSVPARFEPAVGGVARERITSRAREVYAGNPDIERLVELSHRGIWSQVPEMQGQVRAIQREARAGWQELKAAGHDPIFFHRVPRGQEARVLYPRISDKPMTPAQAKKRAWDATPYSKNLGVAMTDQALQLLNKRGNDAFMDTFASQVGRSRRDIEAELLPRAERRVGPDGDLRAELDRMVDARYRTFSPGEFLPWRNKPTSGVQSADDIMVPRVMHDNIRRMFEPPLPGLIAAFDPVMKVFRTSVLPLAPRWHVNNIFGGLIMTMAEDPRAILRIPEVLGAWRANGRGSVLGQIEGAPPVGYGSMPKEIDAWNKLKPSSPLGDRLAATSQWAAGRAMGRWFEQARNSRLARAGSRFVEASYGANQLVDDLYRSAIYLSANKRALKRLGMTADQAEAAGVAAVRKAFMAWDEMTPMERSIMRTVIPFYGFASHILRYTMRYPWDHPVRAEILAALSRTEMEDAATGLPERMKELMWLGDPRDVSKPQRAINTAFNPFADVPSMFTRAGFLGQLNPVITSTLESLGIDVMRGGPMLYPDVRFDPESGRLVAEGKSSPVQNFIGSVVPQTQLLANLAGLNDEWSDLVRRDPEAAGRQLRSLMGLPTVFRDIDTGEELIKAEMARFEDQENARREALRTGNLDAARKYPALGAYLDQIATLQSSGRLAQFSPQQQAGPEMLGLLGGAVLQRG